MNNSTVSLDQCVWIVVWGHSTWPSEQRRSPKMRLFLKVSLRCVCLLEYNVCVTCLYQFCLMHITFLPFHSRICRKTTFIYNAYLFFCFKLEQFFFIYSMFFCFFFHLPSSSFYLIISLKNTLWLSMSVIEIIIASLDKSIKPYPVSHW